MKILKKTLAIIMALLILLSSLSTAAFAQSFDSASVTPTGTSIEDIISDFTGANKTDSSAPIKKQANIRKLSKSTFKATEDVVVRVDNTAPSEVQAAFFNSDGQEIFPEFEITSENEDTTVKVSPPRGFKPGRYRLRIRTSSGQESIQDFTWGVLAINTNKSIYMPDETAKLFLAVLDETGNMVCDADVTLTITDPLGVKQTLTTKDHNIKVNPACYQKVFTLEPDYETRYTVGGIGIYQMALTAVTDNGTYSIQDSFQVQAEVPFDVERSTVTRVYPPSTYPVVFDITANQDFEGVIQEVLPDNFEVGNIPEVKGFDEESTVSVEGNSFTVEENDSIPVLGLPYRKKTHMTQGFGGLLTDPFLFDKYQKYGLVGHDGLDFALPTGSNVIAVSPGKVLIARENFDYGTTIILEHAWGRSYYGHLSELKVKEGDLVSRGDLIGLSGNTGLSTGPHLHFGIKPNVNDAENGYKGKINPLPYMTLIQNGNINAASLNPVSNNGAVRVLKWYVKLVKGEKIRLGYTFKSPPQSPQFYLLGPLEFRSEDIDEKLAKLGTDSQVSSGSAETTEVKTENETVTESAEVEVDTTNPEPFVLGALAFKEARTWQLAIDADGSGTMTVSPSSGATSATQQTYVFTYTNGEGVATGSGSVQIQVPGGVGWSAPQGTAGVAGYTTAVGDGNALVGDVLNTNDVVTGWTELDADMCNTFGVSTATPFQGSGSILCDNNPTSAGPDNNDAFQFTYGSNQNWSTACSGGACTSVSYWMRRTNGTSGTAARFAWSSTTDLPGGEIGSCTVPLTPASNVWQYVTCGLSGTLTTVRSYGFACSNNTCNPFETGDVYIDEMLIGPGVPTFSSNNINFRILSTGIGSTVAITYGSGGGSSGVTNSSTPGVHTFTTLTAASAKGTLTAISSSPTITLCNGGCGPTLDQVLRHGAWFSGGVLQPFTW